MEKLTEGKHLFHNYLLLVNEENILHIYLQNETELKIIIILISITFEKWVFGEVRNFLCYTC